MTDDIPLKTTYKHVSGKEFSSYQEAVEWFIENDFDTFFEVFYD